MATDYTQRLEQSLADSIRDADSAMWAKWDESAPADITALAHMLARMGVSRDTWKREATQQRDHAVGLERRLATLDARLNEADTRRTVAQQELAAARGAIAAVRAEMTDKLDAARRDFASQRDALMEELVAAQSERDALQAAAKRRRAR